MLEHTSLVFKNIIVLFGYDISTAFEFRVSGTGTDPDVVDRNLNRPHIVTYHGTLEARVITCRLLENAGRLGCAFLSGQIPGLEELAMKAHPQRSNLWTAHDEFWQYSESEDPQRLPAKETACMSSELRDAMHLHVVLVLPTYLPESYGGAEQQSRKFADALTRRGHRVTILAPRLDPATPETEMANGVRIVRFRLSHLPNLGGRHFPSFASWTLRTAFWLWRNRADYQIVHIIHGRLHAVGPVMGGLLARRPTLIKFGRGGAHFDIDLVRSKRLLGAQFAAIISRFTTGFIANSSQMVEDLKRHRIGEARIHRIPNGVVMPEIDPGEHLRQIDEARFVYMGRLDREKDIGLMIQGFSALPAKTGARLTIVGEGPQQEELKQLAATLGVRDRVEFTGRLDDVTPALIASDFYLSTSQSEGMSNSMLEAMSYGLVPIVSHVSGVEDIVEDNRNGLIFAAGDVDGLKAALENAISMDPQTYRCFSHNARDTLAARFSMESVTSRHLELYERLAHP